MWASALLDLRSALGDDAQGDSVGDTVVHVAHQLTPANPSFEEASQALFEADASEYGGLHCLAIETEMEDRGFFSNTPCV